MQTEQDIATIQRQQGHLPSVPTWLKIAGLLAVVGVAGWLAYRTRVIRALYERYHASDSFELPGPPPPPITRRLYLEPKFIDPEIAEEILDDVMSTDWLEP